LDECSPIISAKRLLACFASQLPISLIGSTTLLNNKAQAL
jgi:hypothetical protein